MRKDIRLLLVDANPVTCDRVIQILSDAGYSVTATSSADEALILNSKEAFNLIILEIHLADLAGVDLASELLDTGTPFMFLCHSNQSAQATTNDDSPQNQSHSNTINPNDLMRAVTASLSWANEFQRLKETETRYTQAIETGRVVDVVVGILMERHQLEREHAFELLRSKARSERKKLRDLAQEILEALNKINTLSP